MTYDPNKLSPETQENAPALSKEERLQLLLKQNLSRRKMQQDLLKNKKASVQP